MEAAAILRIVSERLGIPEDTLVREGLISYLQTRRRMLMAERFEILSRYNVRSAEELRCCIERGVLPEHPTWEDYIELTNIEDDLSLLEEQLWELQPQEPHVFP
ncbi:MAG: hypothetical protein RMK65_02880 [Anaerolineae bacterium]|nr:hypothetical protein [Anaerolineae bacterium]MCX8066610.1 hypothetical protein [Anaerolineae bacterium]MDW7991087.1 hypothetical protein [Anaerolineae bacterium]